MRKIQKTISLEPMTSRLPSVVPAYMNNELYFFDDAHLKERDYSYTSNYGMIPMNIVVPNDITIPCLEASECLTCSGESAYTYIPSVERGDECDMCQCKIISFERLSIWYHKFKEYYNLLNNYSHCNTVYNSATSYYDNEVKRWPEDLYYGSDKQTYIDLDNEIVCMGGVPKTISIDVTIDCDGNTVSKRYQTFDDDGKESGTEGFYHWICENIVPTYTITREYQDYWQRDTLYYPDVIKWIGWFDERNEYSGYTTEESCKSSPDCCECVEYVKRGGKAERDNMLSWYNSIQSKIICGEEGDKYCSGSTCSNCLPKEEYACVDLFHHECYEPFYIIPLELQNSIEDLGEFSIFSEEYEVGVDYRGASGYGETENTLSGTVVTKDGKSLILKDGYVGYTFDPKYMEAKFDEDAWVEMESSTVESGITAYTTSKLKSLSVDNYLVDDIGNLIEGLYDVSGKTNHQPLEGSVLEPIYQVGRIYNVVRNEDVENQFIGDEIDSMTFYYMTLNGEKSEKVSATTDSVLDAIEEVEIPDDGKMYQEDIFCDVIYHIGNVYSANTVVCNEGNIENCVNVEHLELIDGGEGVEYTDTVQFVKTRTEYYLKKKPKDYTPDEYNVPSAHTISYPIYVYKLKQKETTIRDNTYNIPYNDSLAEVTYDITRAYDDEDRMLPIMREEYKLGIAAPQNIKGDIYIDRGINAAFEKHLKLGEVTSLEALENYGNGYFKITDK